MRFLNDTHVLCLTYDGIKNSVFKSQVLAPLINELDANPSLKITLISFERNKINERELLWHDRIKVIVVSRLPFLGLLSLTYAYWQCKKVLDGVAADCIIARGPLAGAIVIKAISSGWIKVRRCIIQARGLCAQEYRYAMKGKKTFVHRMIKALVYRQLEQLERRVYGCRLIKNICDVKIEAVSPALADYLVAHYQAHREGLYVATTDLIPTLAPALRTKFRIEVRATLGISSAMCVYCYSGSFKPWQGVDEMLEYFCQHYRNDNHAFLLILSSDVDQFNSELKAYELSPHQYKILSVDPSEVVNYLCAVDYGFLFRDKDIINWVSRPTKMLEYHAAGLAIIHNHTVALLAKDPWAN